MQFINYLTIAASVLTPALAAVTSSKPLCAPIADPNTCTLLWNTNTGVNDLTNPYNFVPYAHITIFDNTCKQTGSLENALAPNAPVYAWGMSNDAPLRINTYTNDDNTKFPVFSYNGETYGQHNCRCVEGLSVGLGSGTHVCECPFKCDPFSIN